MCCSLAYLKYLLYENKQVEAINCDLIAQLYKILISSFLFKNLALIIFDCLRFYCSNPWILFVFFVRLVCCFKSLAASPATWQLVLPDATCTKDISELRDQNRPRNTILRYSCVRFR